MWCCVGRFEYCKNSHDHPISKESIKDSWAVPLLEAFEISSDMFINVAIQSRSDKVWKRPLLNQLRLDVDAGVDVANDKVSVGVVVRDSRGVVVGVFSCLFGTHGQSKERSWLQYGHGWISAFKIVSRMSVSSPIRFKRFKIFIHEMWICRQLARSF